MHIVQERNNCVTTESTYDSPTTAQSNKVFTPQFFKISIHFYLPLQCTDAVDR